MPILGFAFDMILKALAGAAIGMNLLPNADFHQTLAGAGAAMLLHFVDKHIQHMMQMHMMQNQGGPDAPA